MKRILFVDDEPNILNGLQNLLRKHRREWDMVFAVGGHEALGELSKSAFDVIVTDMRMPGMDGAALLQRVKSEYPGMARIILSGYAERDAVMRALPVAHQYLTKPCDGEVLRDVIDRVCRQQTTLSDERLRRVIGKLDRLPSAPRVYLELERALSNPDAGVPEVARIVEDDPAMSLKILHLSNSAFFGLSKRVTSAAQAVSYLGIELVRDLALTAHVFAELEQGPPIDGFLLDQLQREALVTAKVVKRFLLNDARQAEYAHTAAVVHDIGQIVMATGMREEFASVVRTSLASKQPMHQVELAMLGATHSEIGAYLLGIWGLPLVIVEAVACHHVPTLIPSEFNATAALHVAVQLTERAMGKSLASGDEIDATLLQRAGWAGKLPRWRDIVTEEVSAASGPPELRH